MAKSEPSKNERHELQVSSTHVMRMSVTGAGLQQAATGCAAGLQCYNCANHQTWSLLAEVGSSAVGLCKIHRQACGHQRDSIPSAAACAQADTQAAVPGPQVTPHLQWLQAVQPTHGHRHQTGRAHLVHVSHGCRRWHVLLAGSVHRALAKVLDAAAG